MSSFYIQKKEDKETYFYKNTWEFHQFPESLVHIWYSNPFFEEPSVLGLCQFFLSSVPVNCSDAATVSFVHRFAEGVVPQLHTTYLIIMQVICKTFLHL